MNISNFFIKRPIFAAVVSIIIFVIGALAYLKLPLSEYPEVVPPTVVVRTSYPGANPTVIADTVASPLEQQINGVEGMLYMFSQATADGVMTLTVTFGLGTDLDKAQVQVQNRVSQALPRLPQEVQRLGVTTEKTSPDLLMVVHLHSPDNRYDTLYLANLAVLQVKDELNRIPGVGNVQIFGAGDFSMRIWLNPNELASHSLTATDVVKAIREQNVQVAAGVLGAPPTNTGSTAFQLLVNTQGRLSSEEEFRDIIVRAGPDGQITRVRDVARVELGSSSYALRSLLDNKSAVAIPISQRPGSNALETSQQVRDTMARLKKSFPQGVEYSFVYDPTVFVRQSIEAVGHTFIEALLLVALVVLIFLQTWRASLIPLLALPVSLVGTFSIMLALGFSLNTLSLFGLVLAIGIVVDDAIVVVENVERHIEEGLPPREATVKAMEEVSGPIVAIALVLSAVFIPTAFIKGLSGEFYKQFALTIAISTVISAFNSLTLSPALAALLLKPREAKKDRLTRWIDFAFGWFFKPFNRFFARASGGYGKLVKRTLRTSAVALAVYAVLILVTGVGFSRVPTGFVPTQDKQYLVALAQLPNGSTLDRTEDVIRKMSAIALKHPGVQSAVAFPGLSINGFTNSPNSGIVFVTLKPFEERKSSDLSANALTASLNQQFAAIEEAFIAIFPPPPVQGVGTVAGFKLYIEDRNGAGLPALYGETKAVLGKGNQTPALAGLFSSFDINVPQIDSHVDREKAKTYGIPLSDIFDTMQVYLGSLYVNDFNRFGRTYQVNVQAESPYRLHPEDIVRLKTRNAGGEMIPLGSVVKVQPSYGPDRVMHYNGFPAAEINGAPAPGYSSGQGEAAMATLLNDQLPNGMKFEWTELTYQKILAGNTMVFIFPLSVFLVYLVLAAQYESWSLPLVVILIVPMTLFSAIAGVWLTHGDNNVFTQISLIVLVGLACKNAILIVEFARERQLEGIGAMDAVLEACRLRLRPILMTSLAFTMGVIPLVLSSGAGSEMRQAIGIAVFFGMLGVTAFGLVLTPVFYVVIQKFVESRQSRKSVATANLHRQFPGRHNMAIHFTKSLGSAFLLLILTGCAVGPHYKAPTPPTVAYHSADPQLVSSAPINAEWWKQFDDPGLDTLVVQTLAANNTIRVARARLGQSRAIYDERKLDRYPVAPVDASYDYSKQQIPGFSDQRVTVNTFRTGFDAFWELDIFGRVSHNVAAGRADTQAFAADLRDVQISTVAELARNYFELRGAQWRLAVAERSLGNQRETLRLTQLRRDAGVGEEQDVASAAARVAATEATIPSLQYEASRATYRVSVLTGVRPGELKADLAPRTYPAIARALPIGDPGELLRRRPDVRAAERRLAEASELQGVAVAGLFPKVSVSGFVGFLAGRGSLFFMPESAAWSVSPGISWSAFDLGRARARVRGSKASSDEALAFYEQTVLGALEETENSLANYRAQQSRLVKLNDQARESKRAADIARLRYREGVIDFLSLLDAERTQLQAEDGVAEAERDVYVAVITLYKALGGPLHQ